MSFSRGASCLSGEGLHVFQQRGFVSRRDAQAARDGPRAAILSLRPNLAVLVSAYDPTSLSLLTRLNLLYLSRISRFKPEGEGAARL